jgi:hypothetical protein
MREGRRRLWRSSALRRIEDRVQRLVVKDEAARTGRAQPGTGRIAHNLWECELMRTQ